MAGVTSIKTASGAHAEVKGKYIKTGESSYAQIKEGYVKAANPEYLGLPTGYTQLKYIESSGTQYIDTGVTPSATDNRVQMDFVTGNTAGSLFGSHNGSTDALTCYWGGFWITGSNPINYTLESGTSYTLNVRAQNNSVTATINGETKTGSYSGTMPTAANFALFAQNNISEIKNNCAIKLMRARIYKDDVLVRDFVPCKNASNTIGLYDMVDGTFYANAGAGTFAAGDAVKAIDAMLFYISQQAGSISVTPTSLSITGAVNTTKTATISYTGDGSISVSSSNDSVATASRGGNTITVTLKGTGSATITISIAETDNYTGASCTLGVSCTVVSSTLNDNSWATIQSAAAAGNGANFWSVGDRKAVTLNGTVGLRTFSSETFYAYILGIDHNESIEGKGIHFQFGFTELSGGRNIAFADHSYGTNNGSSQTCFSMNASSSNTSGWAGSRMRDTICTAFLNVLPTDLRNVIPYTVKYTDNSGNVSDVSPSASSVTSTNDKIFLLGMHETFGNAYGANTHESNYQEQYDYYMNGNSKQKMTSGSLSVSNASWWLRSPVTGSSAFAQVSNSGGSSGANANYDHGFAPAFRVA